MTRIKPDLQSEILTSRQKFHDRLDDALDEIASGIPLNLAHIGNIFGGEFWALIVLCQTNIDLDPGNKKVNITINPK
jgi:hypothetical protein